MSVFSISKSPPKTTGFYVLDIDLEVSKSISRFFKRRPVSFFNVIYCSLATIEDMSKSNFQIKEDKKDKAKSLLPYIIQHLLDERIIDTQAYNHMSEKIKTPDVDDFIETAIDIALHPNLLQSNSWQPKHPFCL